MSRPSVAVLDALLSEVIDNAHRGEWERNTELAPRVDAALSALTADLDANPMQRQEAENIRALQQKIQDATAISEERLTQIRPLVEAFAQAKSAPDQP